MSSPVRRTTAALVLGLALLAGCGSTVTGTAAADPDAADPTTSAPESSTEGTPTQETSEQTSEEPTTEEAPPTSEDSPPDTGPVTIATPKNPSFDDDVCGLLTAEEITAALGAASEPLEPSSFLCSLSAGDSFGLLSYSPIYDGNPVPAPTQVGGNTTLLVDSGDGGCETAVALTEDPDSATPFLSVLLFVPEGDACAAALSLLQSAFDRVPA